MHLLADHVAIVLAGDGLDHHRLHQVRRLAVILQLRSGRPVQREVAHLGAHPRMVGPGRLGHVVGRKAALMRHHLLQRDVGLAARGELRQVVGDLVHEGQLAFLDQRPDRRTGQHLGLAEQQEQVVVGRRHLGGLGLRVAVGAEQRELAVPRERDLRAGIAAFLDMLLDQPVEVIERLGGEAEAGGIAGRQRISPGMDCFSSHLAWPRCYAGRRLRPTGGWGVIRATKPTGRTAWPKSAPPHLMTLDARGRRHAGGRRHAERQPAHRPGRRRHVPGRTPARHGAARRCRLDHRASATDPPRWMCAWCWRPTTRR